MRVDHCRPSSPLGLLVSNQFTFMKVKKLSVKSIDLINSMNCWGTAESRTSYRLRYRPVHLVYCFQFLQLVILNHFMLSSASEATLLVSISCFTCLWAWCYRTAHLSLAPLYQFPDGLPWGPQQTGVPGERAWTVLERLCTFTVEWPCSETASLTFHPTAKAAWLTPFLNMNTDSWLHVLAIVCSDTLYVLVQQLLLRMKL